MIVGQTVSAVRVRTDRHPDRQTDLGIYYIDVTHVTAVNFETSIASPPAKYKYVIVSSSY